MAWRGPSRSAFSCQEEQVVLIDDLTISIHRMIYRLVHEHLCVPEHRLHHCIFNPRVNWIPWTLLETRTTTIWTVTQFPATATDFMWSSKYLVELWTFSFNSMDRTETPHWNDWFRNSSQCEVFVIYIQLKLNVYTSTTYWQILLSLTLWEGHANLPRVT